MSKIKLSLIFFTSFLDKLGVLVLSSILFYHWVLRVPSLFVASISESLNILIFGFIHSSLHVLVLFLIPINRDSLVKNFIKKNIVTGTIDIHNADDRLKVGMKLYLPYFIGVMSFFILHVSVVAFGEEWFGADMKKYIVTVKMGMVSSFLLFFYTIIFSKLYIKGILQDMQATASE